MKKYLVILLLVTGGMVSVQAQTATTQKFHEAHEDAFTLFFYRNTIRMLNMLEDDRVDDLIKNIERMKFIRIDKTEEFINSEYNELVRSYQAESFEDLMTMRAEGMNLNVMIKEQNKITEGLIILMNDDEEFMILDITGAVPLDRVAELITYVQDADGFDF